MADDQIQQMMINFMEKQNAFNLQIIERISKAEVRVYIAMTVLTTAISVAMKYFLPQ